MTIAQGLSLIGGPGDDFLSAQNTLADVIDCGAGADEVNVDFLDRPAAGCAPHLSLKSTGYLVTGKIGQYSAARDRVLLTAGRVSRDASVKITIYRSISGRRGAIIASGLLAVRTGAIRASLRPTRTGTGLLRRQRRQTVFVQAKIKARTGGEGDQETSLFRALLR